MALSANVSQERRKTSRTILQKILYINLEPDNGGIVLDLSEGGLAFCSVAPAQLQGPVRFWFSPPEGGRLEGSGELVWMQQDKKKAGLRFTGLLPATRIHINDLLIPGPSWSRLRAERELREHAATTSSQSMAPQIAQERVTERSTAFTEPAYAADLDAPGPWAAPPIPEGPRQLFWPMAAGLLLTALLIAAGSLLHIHRREAGAAMIRWGEQLEGNSRSSELPTPSRGSQDAAPVPAAMPTPAAPVPSEVHKEETEPRSPLRAVDGTPRLESAASRPNTNTPAAEDEGQEDLTAAQRYLGGAGRNRNSVAASQLLWAALERGNSTAALTLADLYQRGDGVGKNCEQAQVLLKAASEKGNTEAMQRLSDLYRNGCQ